MQTTGPPNRIPWKYHEPVKIPENMRMFFWDEHKGTVPLEKLILRILQYGKFEGIKWLYEKYPEQCYEFINRYPDIRRGVKFWIEKWYEER